MSLRIYNKYINEFNHRLFYFLVPIFLNHIFNIGAAMFAQFNEARIACLILIILLIVCECLCLGDQILLWSKKCEMHQKFESQILNHQSGHETTKKALAQQVTETVEKPKLYQAYQRLAFKFMGGRNNDPDQIHDYDVEQGVGKTLVDQSNRQPVLSARVSTPFHCKEFFNQTLALGRAAT